MLKNSKLWNIKVTLENIVTQEMSKSYLKNVADANVGTFMHSTTKVVRHSF